MPSLDVGAGLCKESIRRYGSRGIIHVGPHVMNPARKEGSMLSPGAVLKTRTPRDHQHLGDNFSGDE
jgi:hypothetical protein